VPQQSLNRPVKTEESSPSLENYVKRSFEKCQNEKERQLIEKSLKKILNNAKLRGEYYTRNWDTYPLPLLPRESKVFFYHSSAYILRMDRILHLFLILKRDLFPEVAMKWI